MRLDLIESVRSRIAACCAEAGEPVPQFTDEQILIALQEASTDSGGQWITIGGQKGEDGKRHGGSPVFIKDGRIIKGAPSLTGKKIGALKEPAEDSTHRKDLNRQKDYQHAVWSKKAKAAGHDPKDLHQLAAEIQAHDKEHVEDRKNLLKDTRAALTKFGYDARALTTNLGKGHVEDEIPHFDLVARTMANRYPGQFAGDKDELDSQQRLVDMLAAGNPQAMTTDEAYEQAFDQLDAMKAGQGDYDFDFGANKEDDDWMRESRAPQSVTERARDADLVTFGKGVEGAVCANCMYVTVKDAADYCENKNVDQALPDGMDKMCCSLWDRRGTIRRWQESDEK